MANLIRLFFFICAASSLWGQGRVGTLLYRTPAGRGMTMEILDAGPGMATLGADRGDAEKFRKFVQRHCVRESTLDRGAKVMVEPPPGGYSSARGRGALLQTATMTYWRYGPDLVLPARFKCMGQFWELVQADVPAREIQTERGLF